MLYMLMCEDKADGESVRLATREAHLAYVTTQASLIRLAGPLLSDDGEHMVGSLFIVEADSAADVQRFHDADPYTRAGLWGKVSLRLFRQVLPKA